MLGNKCIEMFLSWFPYVLASPLILLSPPLCRFLYVFFRYKVLIIFCCYITYLFYLNYEFVIPSSYFILIFKKLSSWTREIAKGWVHALHGTRRGHMFHIPANTWSFKSNSWTLAVVTLDHHQFWPPKKLNKIFLIIKLNIMNSHTTKVYITQFKTTHSKVGDITAFSQVR